MLASRFTFLVATLFFGISCLEKTAGPDDDDSAAEEETTETQPVPPPTLNKAFLQSPEPVCARPSTIICEDFEGNDRSAWSDYNGNGFTVESDDAFGGSSSLRQQYALGQVDAGWLAWFIGDHPLGATRSGERFEEIYFRWYHKFQDGWPAAYPPKMARMRSHYVDCQWCFAWAEHFWLVGSGDVVSDPVSWIAADGTVFTGNERWLGALGAQLSFASLDGRWVALEMRVKLNGPGQSDGRVTFWADGEVVLDRSDLNLRGAYTATTINVAMIDTYWNDGSPLDGLKRWYDNVVVATESVGCAAYTVQKTSLSDQTAWQVQVGLGADSPALVWDSGVMEDSGTEINISAQTGSFSPGAATCLQPTLQYMIRARQASGGEWSEWSAWAPMF